MMSHSVVRLGASPPDNMIMVGVMMVIIDQCVLISEHESGGWVGFN